MADLDEISMMLGEIKSDLRHALRWFDEHENKDQERYEQLVKRIEIHNGVEARVTQVEDTVKEHKPVIEQVKRVRWLGAVTATIVITLSGIASSVGGFIQDWYYR
jgi:hypothetical protein